MKNIFISMRSFDNLKFFSSEVVSSFSDISRRLSLFYVQYWCRLEKSKLKIIILAVSNFTFWISVTAVS